MKTINFELSKRLNEKWLLDNIETEFVYNNNWKRYFSDDIKFVDTTKECNKIHNCEPYYILHNAKSYSIQNQKNEWYIYKTLTTEEAVEFLKNEIWIACDFSISNRHNIDWCIRWNFESTEPNLYFEWEALLETIEKFLEYLIDNNLIWQKQEKL